MLSGNGLFTQTLLQHDVELARSQRENPCCKDAVLLGMRRRGSRNRDRGETRKRIGREYSRYQCVHQPPFLIAEYY
jgi:hypothetical protein